MSNFIPRPRYKAKYRLPVDPCRMLGGKPSDPQQSRPHMGIAMVVSAQTFAKTLRLQGANHQRKYKSRKIREFVQGGSSVEAYKPNKAYYTRSDAIFSNEKE